MNGARRILLATLSATCLAHAAPPPLPLDDEVLAMEWMPSDPAGLAVVGRRTFSIVEAGAGGLRRIVAIDLTGSIPEGARLPRHAVAYLQVPGPREPPAAPILVWSTALGRNEPVAIRWTGGAISIVDPPAAAAPPAPLEGAGARLGRGVALPGRDGATVLFHVDGSGRLIAEPPDGTPAAYAEPVGDALAAIARERGAGSVLASAPSLPGEPDHVREVLWDGAALSPGRTSREFDGAVIALAAQRGGRRVAVAERIARGATLIHLLDADQLWPGGRP